MKMTTLEIKQMLDTLDIPVAYHHFPASRTPSLPFIAYQFPTSDPFFADGKVYAGTYDLDIRLCSEVKDFELEARLDELLDSYDIPYFKSEYWIETERMFETLYEAGVYITG